MLDDDRRASAAASDAAAIDAVVAVRSTAIGPHAAVQFRVFVFDAVHAHAVDPMLVEVVVTSLDVVRVVDGGGEGAVDFAGGSVTAADVLGLGLLLALVVVLVVAGAFPISAFLFVASVCGLVVEKECHGEEEEGAG